MKKQILLFCLSLLSSYILAQVTEIPMPATTPSSHPEGFAVAGGKLFFSATTKATGREMWSSDGTESGTRLVKNLLPESLSGIRSLKKQHQPASLNDALYFISANEGNNESLWATDGTETNTELVKEGLHRSSNLTACGSYIFFLTDDLTHGLELWKTDGTEGGTTMVKDINPGGASAFVDTTSYFTAIEGTLYFSANNGANGYELWKSDGTTDGTVMVRDVNAGVNSSSPSSLYNFNGVLIFSAISAASSYELWKSDGTAGGTVMIRDIYPGIPGSWPSEFAHNDNTLYFAATTADQGREIWTTDGTESGTTLLKDIKAGAASSFPVNFTRHDDRVYFTTSDATLSKFLWRTDGTPAGTVSISNQWLVYDISDFVSLNGELFFTMTEEYYGTRLYGLAAGSSTPVLLSPHIIEYPRFKRGESIYVPEVFTYFSFSFDLPKIAAYDNAIFFSNTDHRGREVWKISSTTSTPELVKDVDDQPMAPTLSKFAVTESSIFVATESGDLFWVDKQAPAEQFHYLRKFTSIDHLTTIGSGVTFLGELPVLYPVYIPEATPLLYTGPDKATALVSHSIYGLTKTLLTTAGDLILFIRATNPGNRVLQYYNTVTMQSGELGRVCYGDSDCSQQDWNFTPFNDTYYYISNSIYFKYPSSYFLQSSIKSLDGKAMIHMDAPAPEINAQIKGLVATSDLLFFTGEHREHGLQLFSSTGVGNAKTMITGPWAPGNPTVYDDKLILTARKKELWTSDGTEAGTGPLAQFDVSPEILKATQLGVFFAAWEEAHGWELWITKGTALSTQLVKDIATGPESGSLGNFLSFAGKLFFTASDGRRGIELWQSDGTLLGTTMVTDGITLSEPSQLKQSDGTLYFFAYNITNSRSLYRYRPHDEVFVKDNVFLCVGGHSEISFFTHDVFNSDNEFTVELSDANGSFETATVIGSARTAEPGPVAIALPAVFRPAEGQYELRIRSSSPSTIIAGTTYPVQFIEITPSISATNTDMGMQLTTENHDRYQWNLENQPVPGATAKEFMPLKTRDYSVSVAKNGCVSTSAAFHTVVTNVEHEPHVITVYPNPAKDQLIIKRESEHWPFETTYTLYDQHGRSIVPHHSETEDGDTILSIQGFCSGLYLLEIVAGRYRSVQKIIIEQ